ncbi:MAG: ergothioneine biosynthesis protein EgtC [Stackebrandtia sp.]
MNRPLCRHLAYLGAPRKLSELLYTPPHSLCHQAYQPKDMRRGGTINADGFGVGWYTGDTTVRYRRHTPIWNDADLPGIADGVGTTAMLAAVRSATVGMPVSDGACAPFTDGRWLFSLNGSIKGWPDSVAELARKLPVTTVMSMDAPTDAAFLWILLRERLRDNDPAEAVRGVTAELVAAAPGSRLNLLLTDGSRAVATTWWHALSVHRDSRGVTLASEPLDEGPAWRAVDDRKLVTATASDFEISDLNV